MRPRELGGYIAGAWSKVGWLQGVFIGFTWIAVILPGFGLDAELFLRATHAFVMLWERGLYEVFRAIEFLIPFNVEWGRNERLGIAYTGTILVPLNLLFVAFVFGFLEPRVRAYFGSHSIDHPVWYELKQLNWSTFIVSWLILIFVFAMLANINGRGSAVVVNSINLIGSWSAIALNAAAFSGAAYWIYLTQRRIFKVIVLVLGFLFVMEIALHIAVIGSYLDAFVQWANQIKVPD